MTIILVHGLWSAPAHWRGVIEALKALGVTDVVTVDLPLESLKGDVDVVREAIRKAGGDVVLAGQGFAGMVITEAGAEEAVKGLVYVCALAPDAGESARTVFPDLPSEIASDFEVVDRKLRIKEDAFKADYCHDLSDEAVAWLRETGRNPSASIMGEAVTHAAWKDKPSFYIVAGGDKCIAKEKQDRMADRIKASRIACVDGASHAMHVGHPGEVGLFVAGVARSCGV
ncbi:alpha/beta-hydrolase [Cutaneotrichosporon oleaginosum]|uniref:Alpha/beta-hydrolase n=1 Tax=Cutaneotrichosporon oleaginosum TaxID=879819 RepID=A0A0J1B813_9TREE|nr:alpha/beta-hydrolase [Cutaneotrichosporon oleaginosum]KLT43899.1 alpha/beta-hydrolase [Cutaneotrichosporon oleaginosum]TXT06362.1 hypothetical protein COLE_05693 [Cutaneotrichosporon oleaginosum]